MVAVNNYVWIIRDETEAEIYGLFIPSEGRKNKHTGIIKSVGELVKDKEIQIDRKAIWHQTDGQEVEYDGIVYIVIIDEKILGVDE